MGDNQTLVALCIPAFKWSIILRQCLFAIGKFNLPGNLKAIIIIDNDSDQSGGEVCNNISSGLNQALH